MKSRGGLLFYYFFMCGMGSIPNKIYPHPLASYTLPLPPHHPTLTGSHVTLTAHYWLSWYLTTTNHKIADNLALIVWLGVCQGALCAVVGGQGACEGYCSGVLVHGDSGGGCLTPRSHPTCRLTPPHQKSLN